MKFLRIKLKSFILNNLRSIGHVNYNKILYCLLLYLAPYLQSKSKYLLYYNTIENIAHQPNHYSYKKILE